MTVVTRTGRKDPTPAVACCPTCRRGLVKGSPRGRFSVLCRSCRAFVEIEVLEDGRTAYMEAAPRMG